MSEQKMVKRWCNNDTNVTTNTHNDNNNNNKVLVLATTEIYKNPQMCAR